ncbi:MAG: TetR family transcriptional regulator [Clostridiales bacterium]|nr:TetR family transcriptional regulator [Clostridiales bacterium]
MASRSAVNNKDLRVKRTYKMLKEAFMVLLSQRPFEQLTVQEICEKAMVRRTTFYQHFEDKHDFLSWFIQEQQHDFTEMATSGVTTDDLQEYYAQALRNALKYLRENAPLIHLLLDAGVEGQLLMDAFSRGCVADVTEKLSREENIKERLGDVPIPFLAEFYVGGLIAAAKWWFAQGHPCSEEDMMQYVRCFVVQPPKA